MNFESINMFLTQTFSNSFAQFLESLILFIPKFVIAVFIVLVGWFFGGLIGKAGAQLVRVLKISRFLKNIGLDRLTERMGIAFKPRYFVGKFLQWLVVVIALMGAFDLIGLSQVNNFLGRVIAFIPSILVVLFILIIASALGEFLRKVVVKSAMAARVEFAGVIGSVAKWTIMILAILAALFELGIAATFIQTIFTGFIVTVSLALGLAFGIGGYPHAQEFIGSLKKQFKQENNPDLYVVSQALKTTKHQEDDQLNEDELKRDLQS